MIAGGSGSSLWSASINKRRKVYHQLRDEEEESFIRTMSRRYESLAGRIEK